MMAHRFFCVFLGVLALAGAPKNVEARTWYVSSDGTGDVPTIMVGLDSAEAGDTVLVECGVYQEDHLRVRTGVTLRSLTGRPDCVTISGNHDGSVFLMDSPAFAGCLEGLTITGGSGSGAQYAGGGIACVNSNPKILGCVLAQNQANLGGGLYCSNADPDVYNCRFLANTANYGGGIYCTNTSGLSFYTSAFQNNAAISGGGLYSVHATGQYLLDCAMTGNTASVEGGGIFVPGDVNLTLWGCLLDGNSAGQRGGAIYQSDTRIAFDRCTVVDNTAGTGGGIFFERYVTAQISRSVFSENAGMLWFDCGDDWTMMIDLRCSDVYGNLNWEWPGCIAGHEGTNGNFSASPLFCNADAGDFTLRSDSPCLPGHHPDGYECGLIGAFGEGCSAPTGVEQTTWGGVKRMFR